MTAMCSRDAAASLSYQDRRPAPPPTYLPLPGGTPGWVADTRYVARVAALRSDNLRDMEFWLALPNVALLLDDLVAASEFRPATARGAVRFLRDLADELPRPLTVRGTSSTTMLTALPPAVPLSPNNPWVIAARAHGSALVTAFLGPPDAFALAVTVDHLQNLLLTYCLAASLPPTPAATHDVATPIADGPV